MVENQTLKKTVESTKSPPPTKPARRIVSEDTIDAILLRLECVRTSSTDPYVLGITSCGRRAGVSTIAGKMAVRAAEMSLGRVLLVDANLDFPNQARQFRLKRKQGFAEAMLGVGELQDKVFNGAVDRLHVMPAGAPSNRNTSLSPDVCASVMKELRQDFNWVFVDLPPITDSARFLLVSRQTDGLALVVDARSTRARELQHAVQILEGSGTSIVGTILNRKTRTLPKWLDRWV